jgi:hypothetical protein
MKILPPTTIGFLGSLSILFVVFFHFIHRKYIGDDLIFEDGDQCESVFGDRDGADR